jgi:hypothetical protein
LHRDGYARQSWSDTLNGGRGDDLLDGDLPPPDDGG